MTPLWFRWRTSAAAALSGLLLALAFPPVGAVVLLPIAFVPWLVALTGEKSRGRALLSGVVFGLAHWCAAIPWIVYVVTHYGGQNGVMGIVCLVILALILAEWPALVAFASGRGRTGRLAVAARRVPDPLGRVRARPHRGVQGLPLEPDGTRSLPASDLDADGVDLGGRGARRSDDRRRVAASPRRSAPAP